MSLFLTKLSQFTGQFAVQKLKMCNKQRAIVAPDPFLNAFNWSWINGRVYLQQLLLQAELQFFLFRG